MIESVVNQNFVHIFQHYNVPNQRQHTKKKTSQQYQTIWYQKPRISLIKYLEEDTIGCVLNNIDMRELLIQYDEKLETCPFK